MMMNKLSHHLMSIHIQHHLKDDIYLSRCADTRVPGYQGWMIIARGSRHISMSTQFLTTIMIPRRPELHSSSSLD